MDDPNLIKHVCDPDVLKLGLRRSAESEKMETGTSPKFSITRQDDNPLSIVEDHTTGQQWLLSRMGRDLLLGYRDTASQPWIPNLYKGNKP